MDVRLAAKRSKVLGILTGLVAAGKKGFATSSFQPQSLPLLHMISEVDGLNDICFTNTGFLFPETLSFAEDVCRMFELNLVVLKSDVPKAGQRDARNRFLYGSDPDLCCHLNKVLPVNAVMHGYDFWVNGVRADQSQARSTLREFENKDTDCIRYHPLLNWSAKDVWEYGREFSLPEHPLSAVGYQSIGCEPCTVKWDASSNERNSRWFGLNKTECGLNTDLIASSGN